MSNSRQNSSCAVPLRPGELAVGTYTNGSDLRSSTTTRTERLTSECQRNSTSAPTGSDDADGSELYPLRTISCARLAQPGTRSWSGGVYREWVRPRYSGLSDRRPHHLHRRCRRARGDQRLRAGDRLAAAGRECVAKVTVSNDLFGSFNLSLRRSPATGSSTGPHPPEAPRRGLSQRDQLLRSRVERRRGGSAAAYGDGR